MGAQRDQKSSLLRVGREAADSSDGGNAYPKQCSPKRIARRRGIETDEYGGEMEVRWIMKEDRRVRWNKREQLSFGGGPREVRGVRVGVGVSHEKERAPSLGDSQ